MPDPGAARVAAALAAMRPAEGPFIVALTGSVASGKTTFASALKTAIEAWDDAPHVEVACTDGFLRPNAELQAAGIINRKGYPETFDAEAMSAALAAVRRGPAHFPAHSHVTYDIDPALERTLSAPDVLILEGLALHTPVGADALIYLDAGEAQIEAWFVERFVGLWREAEHDETSFYRQFRTMDEPALRDFARMVWNAINLPNLRDHIGGAKAIADIVVTKGPDHAVEAVTVKRSA